MKMPFPGGGETRFRRLMPASRPSSSDGVVPRLAGPDAHGLFHVRHEDLPVADAAGLGGGDDRVDRLRHHVVAEHEFELHLGEKVHDIFGAAIELGVALLAAEALGLGHGDALEADFLQRLFHLIKLEGLDDRFDLFHCFSRTSPEQEKDACGPRPSVRVSPNRRPAKACPMPILKEPVLPYVPKPCRSSAECACGGKRMNAQAVNSMHKK